VTSRLDRIEADIKRGAWVVSFGDDDLRLLVAVARAADTLLREYENEEEEHGFPFNFALRDAHRATRLALAPLLADEDTS
jgi:hypothetical protein